MAESKTPSTEPDGVVVESTTDPEIAKASTPDKPEGTGEISKSAASNSPHITREKETGKELNPDQNGQITAPPIEQAKAKAAKSGNSVRVNPAGQVDTRSTGIMTNAHKIDPDNVELVPVKMKSYSRNKIGPAWYEFHVGKTYNVLPNVKDILAKAGKLEVL